MLSDLGIGDGIALCAIVISLYATFSTARFQRTQRALNDSQEQLNRRMLEKASADADAERRADLGASIIKLGSSQYRLKVYNRGKATARDVRISFADDEPLVFPSELAEKFPLESLAPQQSVELSAAVHLGSRRKHCVVVRWSDDAGLDHERTHYVTI